MCRDKVRCTPGQFMCQLTGSCVSIRAVCDGTKDCEDGSDEFGCTAPTGDSTDEQKVSGGRMGSKRMNLYHSLVSIKCPFDSYLYRTYLPEHIVCDMFD